MYLSGYFREFRCDLTRSIPVLRKIVDAAAAQQQQGVDYRDGAVSLE